MREKVMPDLIAVGLLKDSDKKIGEKNIKDFVFKIEIPEFTFSTYSRGQGCICSGNK